MVSFLPWRSQVLLLMTCFLSYALRNEAIARAIGNLPIFEAPCRPLHKVSQQGLFSGLGLAIPLRNI